MTKHTKEKCDCPYKRKPKFVSRGYWICPICKRDVSLEYVMLKFPKE